MLFHFKLANASAVLGLMLQAKGIGCRGIPANALSEEVHRVS
jgi:hypothetical protein